MPGDRAGLADVDDPSQTRRTLGAVRSVAIVIGSVAALVTAAPAAALCAPTHRIDLTADGPQPAELHVQPEAIVGVTGPQASPPSRIVFAAPACEITLDAGPGSLGGCGFVQPGIYPYRVEGFGAGTGTVVVDPVDWVTLRAATPVVEFGRAATVAGAAYPGNTCGPPQLERPRIVVVGRTSPRGAFGRRASAPLGGSMFPDYRWRLAVRPRIATEYRARWSEYESVGVTIRVRPKVTLGRAGPQSLRVSVRSLRGYRGRWVAVQRRSTRGWRFVRAVRLRRGSTATFRLARRGTVVRVFVPRSVAGRGYVAGVSRPLALG